VLAPIGLADFLCAVWICKKRCRQALIFVGQRQIGGILNTAANRSISSCAIRFYAGPLDIISKCWRRNA